MTSSSCEAEAHRPNSPARGALVLTFTCSICVISRNIRQNNATSFWKVNFISKPRVVHPNLNDTVHVPQYAILWFDCFLYPVDVIALRQIAHHPSSNLQLQMFGKATHRCFLTGGLISSELVSICKSWFKMWQYDSLLKNCLEHAYSYSIAPKHNLPSSRPLQTPKINSMKVPRSFKTSLIPPWYPVHKTLLYCIFMPQYFRKLGAWFSQIFCLRTSSVVNLSRKTQESQSGIEQKSHCVNNHARATLGMLGMGNWEEQKETMVLEED